jgi:2-polyprenyl-3-methyl-5-hydroxy-6-metoxy-1,4-benzoquinol methylase
MSVKVRFEERPAGDATMTPEMLNASNYYRWTVSQFQPYLGERVLDIGGGYGSHLQSIVESGRPVFSIDLSESSVEYMRERFRDFPNFSAAPLDFGSQDDLQHLIDQHFDTITCMNVLEHIEDDLATLRLMHTLLRRQQGMLFLQVPAHPWLYGSLDHQAGHYRRYSRAYLRSILQQAGFTIERLYHFNSFGVLPWFINARILRQRLESDSMNLQVKIFDRWFVPVLSRVESVVHLPLGQSLMAVAKAGDSQ